jgi:type IV pilus assembly protein PilA
MINTINTAVARRRAELQNGENDKGFTLIELMVVIIIIGILAAIAIPVFLNQRQSAWESSVKSDLANAGIAAESYSVKNNGTYAGITVDDLTTNGLKLSDKNHITVVSADATSYKFTAYNEDLGSSKVYTSTTGKVTGP